MYSLHPRKEALHQGDRDIHGGITCNAPLNQKLVGHIPLLMMNMSYPRASQISRTGLQVIAGEMHTIPCDCHRSNIIITQSLACKLPYCCRVLLAGRSLRNGALGSRGQLHRQAAKPSCDAFEIKEMMIYFLSVAPNGRFADSRSLYCGSRTSGSGVIYRNAPYQGVAKDIGKLLYHLVQDIVHC